jgi:lysine decarboxylase
MPELHPIQNASKGSALSQEETPILSSLLDTAQYGTLQFHVPAHKQGRFFPSDLKQILGDEMLAIDLPSMNGVTDNTFHSTGCIKTAQELAADLYGAAHTRFLVNGSTIGVMAAVMASVAPGKTILLPRNIHRSVASALVLSGAHPIYLMPQFHPNYGAMAISVDEVRQAFQRYSDISAVLLTRPSYYGLAGVIEEIAKICHENKCPLLIDEAHGAHLRFLPKGYITPALDLSADIVIQSPHKMLGSLTGTAQIHVGHNALVDIEQLQLMLNYLQTTSPNYILLASLDATRHMMWQQGHDLFAAAVKRAQKLRDQIDAIPGLSTLRLSAELVSDGYTFDPMKLVVNFDGLEISGFVAAKILDEEYDIGWEMCDNHNVVLILSPQDGDELYDPLLTALEELAVDKDLIADYVVDEQAENNRSDNPPHNPPLPTLALLPREAAFSPKVVVPFEQAIGKICGEVITIYPPGIPILCPGEIISQEIIDFCLLLKHEEADISATDSSLQNIVVIDK